MSAIVRPVTYSGEIHFEMIEKVRADTIVPGDKISASKSGAFQFVNKVVPGDGTVRFTLNNVSTITARAATLFWRIDPDD